MSEVEIDYSGAYGSLRSRVIDLIRSATDEQLEAHPPATPDWRTRDVLAHLTGVTTDVLSGNIEGAATDPWTEAQVDARRDRSVAEIVAEWEANGPQIDPLIPSFGVIAGQFLGDAVTHEHDIRGVLGAPGERDSDAIAIVYAWFGDRFGEMRDEADAGALRVETEAGIETFGSGEPSARCTTSRFEIVRAGTGRRCVEQITAWEWDGDPRPELLVLPIFTLRPDPLLE